MIPEIYRHKEDGAMYRNHYHMISVMFLPALDMPESTMQGPVKKRTHRLNVSMMSGLGAP